MRRFFGDTSSRLAFFACLAVVTTWPLLSTATATNLFRDAQVLFSYERNAAWTVLRHGQLPLWDPYYCGGLYALGAPQTRFASPTFLLSLLFGPARGEALTITLLMLLGLEGTYRYARLRGAGPLGAVLAAPGFAISGVFIASPYLGWTNFFGFELIPWTLLGIRRVVRGDLTGAPLAAAVLACIIGFGGTYSAPFAVLMWVFELGEASPWSGNWRAVWRFALTGLLAVGLSAVRLFPLLETLYSAPRTISGTPAIGVPDALSALLLPVRITDGEVVWPGQMYTIGGGMLALAAVGIAHRRTRPLTVMAALAFYLALGFAPGIFGLFPLLEHVPFYRSLRYPERYLIIVAFAVAIIAANGIRLLEARARRLPGARRWLLAACLLLVGNTVLLVLNFRAVAKERSLAPAAPELAREFHQARGNRWLAAFYAPMSRGSLQCWDAYPVPMSPHLRGDLQSEEYLASSGDGSVARKHWSPNAIDLDVELARPAEVRVNQNYHPGWRSNLGVVHDADGLLAVSLPAGRHRLALRFRPRSALAGAAASLLALLLVTAFWIRGHHRPRTLVAASFLPVALAGGMYLAISERAPSRPVPRAPSGEAVTVPSPPPEAKAIGARFGSVILEAARVPPKEAWAPDAITSLELDWRVTGAVPRHLGVVLQVESGGKDVLTLDHQLISATLDLAEAPRGQTLRDIVPFVLPASLPAELEVWVGLSTGGAAPVDHDRVLIARISH